MCKFDYNAVEVAKLVNELNERFDGIKTHSLIVAMAVLLGQVGSEGDIYIDDITEFVESCMYRVYEQCKRDKEQESVLH